MTIKEEKMKLNVMENEIPDQLKDLTEVFKTILEGELSLSYEEVNHEIKLKTKKIKSSPLISIRLKEQQIVKKYLNEIIRKE